MTMRDEKGGMSPIRIERLSDLRKGDYGGSTKPHDPDGMHRFNAICAKVTVRLSGGLWTFKGDQLVRTDKPTPSQIRRAQQLHDARCENPPPAPKTTNEGSLRHALFQHMAAEKRLDHPLHGGGVRETVGGELSPAERAIIQSRTDKNNHAA